MVINVYCPMYDPERDKDGESISRLKYKIDFYHLLEERCSALEQAGKYLNDICSVKPPIKDPLKRGRPL